MIALQFTESELAWLRITVAQLPSSQLTVAVFNKLNRAYEEHQLLQTIEAKRKELAQLEAQLSALARPA